jgi:hypothetical protein
MGQSLPGRASSNSGHVRYAPKAEESSLPVICLFSSLLKGGKVPIAARVTLALWHPEYFDQF